LAVHDAGRGHVHLPGSLSSICFLPLSSFSQAADDHEPDVPRRHSKPVISLHDLRVSYGEREILHGISFDVQPAKRW